MTVRELIQLSAGRLEKAGIPSSRLDSELLISYALHCDRLKLITEPDQIIDSKQIRAVDEFVKRREKREPLAYITGTKEFYGLSFFVNPSCLIPRPETEFLVEEVIQRSIFGACVLDLCTGSGAIAVSIKSERSDLLVSASDISREALETARKNAAHHHLLEEINFLQSDLFSEIYGTFDIIVTNPPYIPYSEKDILEDELFYEPECALFAEDDGEKIAKQIIFDSSRYLKPDGVLLMEIHSEKTNVLEKIASVADFSVTFKNDYASLPRVAIFERRGTASDR